MTTPPNAPSPPARRSRVWLAFVLTSAIVAGGLWWVGRWWTRPTLPEIALAGADPEVVTRIRRAEMDARETPRSADAWGHLGMTLMANKFEEEAVAPLALAERLDPIDPRWPYLRGVALLGRNPDDAIPCLRCAIARCRDEDQHDAAELRLAEALASNGREDEAKAHFESVSAGPLTPVADYGLGALAATRGDLEESKRRMTNCANSPLTRGRAAAQLAALARRLKEKDSDRPVPTLPPDPPWPDPFLTECLKLVAGKEGRLKMVNVLEAQGRPKQALEVLRALVAEYPDAETHLATGIVLGRTGQFSESEKHLRQCLALEPRLVRAEYYLSLALFAQAEVLQREGRSGAANTRFDEAARSARRATELAPQNGEAHLQLGMALWSLKRRKESIEAFRRAVATRPELADGHLWLGKALAQSGKKVEAMKHLRDAERVAQPNDDRARKAMEAVEAGTTP